MPRFNIFKALVRRTGNSPNQSKVPDRSLPEHSSNLGNSQSLPSKKPRAVLTKRRPLGRQETQPTYLHSEDIGHHELGRYPTNLPEPTVSESKPPQYTDSHSHVEETRIDYPTMTQDSFHPIGQSSKRWSPVPDVYREPVTEEYDGDDTVEPKGSLHESLHMQEPQQHVRSRELQRSRSRKRIEAGSDDDIPLSRSTTGIAYPHGHRGGIPIDVDPDDTHDIHYLPDSTMRSDFPDRSLSMKKSPVSFTGGEHVLHNEAYPRDRDSDYIEPVIFEHEVIRNDGGPNPKIWHYIVPGGLDVIFKDEDGNELTRIRNMGDKSTKRIIPMVIEDEHGKVIYRTGDDSLSDGSGSDLGGPQKKYSYEPRHQKPMKPEVPGSEPVLQTPVWIRRRSGSPVRHVYTSYLSPEAEKVILINEHGKQIPLVDRRKRRPAKQGRQPKDEKLR